MTGAIRAAIRAVDPDLPIASVATLETIVDDAMAQPRFSMLLVGGFGALALLLACVGLYGAVAYSVTSRAQEIGIRLALGAPRRRVFALVLGQCVRITSLGIAIGVALALVRAEGDGRVPVRRRGDGSGDVRCALGAAARRRAARLLRARPPRHARRSADRDARGVVRWVTESGWDAHGEPVEP